MNSLHLQSPRTTVGRPKPRRESGATLIVALIFLVVLTLLVFSGVKTGALSFRIANNVQYQREAIAAAQAVIDSKLTGLTYFNSPPTTSITYTPTDTNIPNYTVTLLAPKCLGLDTSEAAGKKTQYGGPVIPSYIWELEAKAVDTTTGTSVDVVQGVKLQQAIGSNCPN